MPRNTGTLYLLLEIITERTRFVQEKHFIHKIDKSAYPYFGNVKYKSTKQRRCLVAMW